MTQRSSMVPAALMQTPTGDKWMRNKDIDWTPALFFVLLCTPSEFHKVTEWLRLDATLQTITSQPQPWAGCPKPHPNPALSKASSHITQGCAEKANTDIRAVLLGVLHSCRLKFPTSPWLPSSCCWPHTHCCSALPPGHRAGFPFFLE